ncbi:hypothetical protein BOX37_31150 [Nocardia mangyaensis]|uniref:Uncharacterized protein n=2 Tax=Nocardia mangyaensis TaxID=2213200 RepID=A0A1J0W061_9NOCA|nr:hypothetical protein BOX37_31150 [Nocardia mangyaensis]
MNYYSTPDRARWLTGIDLAGNAKSAGNLVGSDYPARTFNYIEMTVDSTVRLIERLNNVWEMVESAITTVALDSINSAAPLLDMSSMPGLLSVPPDRLEFIDDKPPAPTGTPSDPAVGVLKYFS